MPATPSRKEETHDRIVRTAARAIRARGYAGVGVADVMKEAGLTHGGFYAHFGSRTDMLAEAADRAGAEGVDALRAIADAAAPADALDALVDAYLSAQHVAAPDTGCPVAALGSEIPRQEAPVRAAATERIRDLVGLLDELLARRGAPAGTARREQAQAHLATMVGALMLARAVDDPTLSRAFRKAARQHLHTTAA